MSAKAWAALWVRDLIPMIHIGPYAAMTVEPLPPFRKPEPWEYRPEFRP